MRWDTLRLVDVEPPDGALPLFAKGAVVRQFDTPGFRGITFYEIHARSALNRVPEASQVPFRWTVNPYRGCSHACVYCQTGDTPILMADASTKPLADIRAFVGRLRAHEGIGALPPVILATLRKGMIALAGEIADGMVFANGARSHMASSLAALPAGRRPPAKPGTHPILEPRPSAARPAPTPANRLESKPSHVRSSASEPLETRRPPTPCAPDTQTHHRAARASTPSNARARPPRPDSRPDQPADAASKAGSHQDRR